MSARSGFPSARITTNTTTTVKATGGTIQRVLVEAALTGTATFNEVVSGVSTVLFILPVAMAAGLYELNLLSRGKIEVVTSAADRLVVVYE